MSYSSPTRLVAVIKDIPKKIKIPSKEIKGPKVGVFDDILNSFIRAHDSSKKEVFEKENEKGKFYFIKTKPREVLAKELLIKITLNSIALLNWKKSMKWSDNNLLWGRPLRSILAVYNNEHLLFNYGHLKSKDSTYIEKNLILRLKKIKKFSEYQILLKKNNIILDQEERKLIIISKFKKICENKNFVENFNLKLLEEVINIVEDPNVLLIDFDKKYLEIPSEIIISTLQGSSKIFSTF